MNDSTKADMQEVGIKGELADNERWEIVIQVPTEGMTHPSGSVDFNPVAYIQRDHLQKARVAPFLCRVEPTQRLPDFDPIYARAVFDTGDTLSEEKLDSIMRVCIQIANRYAFVGDAAFPRGREKLRAVLAGTQGEGA